METKFCKDCEFCIEKANSMLYFCKKEWSDLVTGRVVNFGGNISCWQARQNYCGVSAIGFQDKRMNPPMTSSVKLEK